MNKSFWSWWCHVATFISAKIDSGNVVLFLFCFCLCVCFFKPLPEPMLIHHQWGRVTFTWLRAVSQEMFKESINDLCLKNTNLKLQPHIIGSNNLCISWSITTMYCSNYKLSNYNGLYVGCQAIIWTNAGLLLIGTQGANFSEFKHFHSRKGIWKYRLENSGHFVSASMC